MTNGWAVKVATATIGGFITIFLGPWAFAFVVGGVRWLPEPSAFLHLAIGLAALTGVIAFWVWVFSRAPLSSRRRLSISTGIACGIIAALVVVVKFSVRSSFQLNVLTSALLLGVLVGVAVIASLWLQEK